ncbi:hypothetical protein VFPPC_18485 [Pochonia chlamydosporia 170]|uniref:Uncharacterized protein n=1 Tax=Pochonia chlamydosporia 170 TaxID=1380566 RepID=A0A219APY0_METCM|nr:hypothetical protein VFPPC_18485 [Pochonia chlamydosporia 170]OWT42374.1 hypothetical protein VFPPC_18485 [Pochonia chlamydosporia 170]
MKQRMLLSRNYNPPGWSGGTEAHYARSHRQAVEGRRQLHDLQHIRVTNLPSQIPKDLLFTGSSGPLMPDGKAILEYCPNPEGYLNYAIPGPLRPIGAIA